MTCLTHPVLCPRSACPDYRECQQQKAYIVSMHARKHGASNKNHDAALSTGGSCQAGQTEGEKRGKVLGGMAAQDSRNSRRVKKSCLSIARNDQQAGL